jgi:hypothetical protein
MARRSPQKTKAQARPRPVPKNSAQRPTPAIATLARRHAEAALAALIEVVGDRTASPAARISAASALLNWGFGKSGAGDDEDNGPAELVIRWRNVQDGQAAEPEARRPNPKPGQTS